MQTLSHSEELSCTAGAADLFTLKSTQVGRHWPAILKLLNRVEDPDWTTDQVYEEIVNTRAQVWGIASDGEIKGIWITRIVENARDVFGIVWIAAGEGLEVGLFHFLHETEDWFREKGCRYVDIFGRKGWQKVLPGYEFKTVQLRKYL